MRRPPERSNRPEEFCFSADAQNLSALACCPQPKAEPFDDPDRARLQLKAVGVTLRDRDKTWSFRQPEVRTTILCTTILCPPPAHGRAGEGWVAPAVESDEPPQSIV